MVEVTTIFQIESGQKEYHSKAKLKEGRNTFSYC